MAALMTSTIRVKDREKLQDYLQQVKALGAQYGAEMLFSGPAQGPIAGDQDHDLVVIVRFPTTEDIDALFGSEAYAPLLGLREAAADMVILKYQDAA